MDSAESSAMIAPRKTEPAPTLTATPSYTTAQRPTETPTPAPTFTPEPTATATATPTPEPTSTPTPEPTATASPTATPEPTCDTHDKTVWHGWLDNPCDGTWPHGHGDILGVNRLAPYRAMHGADEVSGIYETPQENALKHVGYYFLTENDTPSGGNCSGADCVAEIAIESHFQTAFNGYFTEVHSVFAAITTANGGTFTTAGWVHCGDGTGPRGYVPATIADTGLQRAHSVANPLTLPNGEVRQREGFTWYCRHGALRFATEGFGVENYPNSRSWLHGLSVEMSPGWYGVHECAAGETLNCYIDLGGGRFDAALLTDEHGTLSSSCTLADVQASPTCSLTTFENWAFGRVAWDRVR
jgi:hypothetical protein